MISRTLALWCLAALALVCSVAEAGAGGVSYIRWGRTTCPGHSRLVYRGFVAGQYYGHVGGASDPLCLPHTPKYGSFSNQAGNFITGAEYEPGQRATAPFRARTYQNAKVPCAVCLTAGRTTTIMMPARNDCPADWQVEYTGYLMSGSYRHPGREQFTCVDRAAEAVPNSRPTDGYLFYTVGALCSHGIPCTSRGYVNRRELTCAVCSH